MFSYAAFLGHQPHISAVEICSVLPDCTIKGIFNKQVAIFETAVELDSSFLNELGGTMILARQIIKSSVSLNEVPKLLANELQKAKKGKVTFSLRAVGVAPKSVRDLYRSCKQHLKNNGRPSRYVGTDRKAAPAIVLHENDMIEGKQGCEIVVLRDEEGELWVGRTIGAQNVNAYTKRDMEKPVRDTGVGLLPPKLAQILLNFGVFAAAHGKKDKKPSKKFKLPKLTVFDPFCGTGVIPLECLLRKWPVFASDIALKAVNGCKKNIEWMRKEEKILKKDCEAEVWKQDATKPFPKLCHPEHSRGADVIVTETSLGPNLLKKPTLKDVQKMKTENEALQAAFLKNAAQTLPGVPIVCTFPVWYHSKGITQLSKIWSEAEETGYCAVLPHELSGDVSGNLSLIYRRPNQMVGREIVVFVSKK